MFTEAQNFAIVQTELDSVFYQEFDYDSAAPSFATSRDGELFKVVETTHAAYIEEVFKGSGMFPAIGEVQTVPLSTPRVANKLTTLVVDFAQGIELSKDLFDDNMHGVWAAAVRDLAQKARLTQDNNAFGLFRNGFTTTLTADGVAWFSASHALIGGGTLSNLVTGPLNPDNLNSAIVALQQQKDQSGVIMGNQPSILVVPPALFKKALEITESALLADSGNNNINVYRSAYGMKVVYSPWLGAAAGGSDTAWFLLSRNHAVKRLARQGLETALRPWQMSNNRTYFYQANYREAYYVVDYVGSVGSTGL